MPSIIIIEELHHPFPLHPRAAVVVELVPLCEVGLFEELIDVELAHLLLVDALAERANLVEGGLVDLEVDADLEHLHVVAGEFGFVDVADEGVAAAVGLEGLVVGLRVFVHEGGVAVGAFQFVLLQLLEVDPVIGIKGTLVEIPARRRLALLDVLEQLSRVDDVVLIERADAGLFVLGLRLSEGLLHFQPSLGSIVLSLCRL